MNDLADLLGQRSLPAPESQTRARDVASDRYHALPKTVAGSEHAAQGALQARRRFPLVSAPHKRVDAAIGLLEVAGQ